MKFTINSRKLKRNITFSRPALGYVYVDLNNQPGCLGLQICRDGEFMGSTITYSGHNIDDFKKICRYWFRRYLRHNHE